MRPHLAPVGTTPSLTSAHNDPVCVLPASLAGKGLRLYVQFDSALPCLVTINLKWHSRAWDVVCAALPPSLQQTECTRSKQVGPVAARPSETQCSAVELARRNGRIMQKLGFG